MKFFRKATHVYESFNALYKSHLGDSNIMDTTRDYGLQIFIGDQWGVFFGSIAFEKKICILHIWNESQLSDQNYVKTGDQFLSFTITNPLYLTRGPIGLVAASLPETQACISFSVFGSGLNPLFIISS